MNNKIPQEIEEKIIEKFNLFIEKWCGDNFPHLIDNDDNDGEDFRDELRGLFQAGQKQNLDFTDGFREGRLYEQNKFKEMIEEMEDTHCCFTDWRNNGKRIWVKELLSKIGDNSEVKE